VKRTCRGCRAITFVGTTRCLLGFKIKIIGYDGIVVGAVPKEECPKPRTYSEFIYLERKRTGMRQDTK